MKNGSIEKEIISLLDKHVYGLSIGDVSRLLGISRITSAKYLAILVASDKVAERSVGNTKLHYLPKNYIGDRT